MMPWCRVVPVGTGKNDHVDLIHIYLYIYIDNMEYPQLVICGYYIYIDYIYI